MCKMLPSSSTILIKTHTHTKKTEVLNTFVTNDSLDKAPRCYGIQETVSCKSQFIPRVYSPELWQ